MGLRVEDAINSELRVTGTQKNGRYVRRRRFYTFRCSDCSNTFTPQRTDLKKLSGRCRKCADRHGAQITGKKLSKRPYEALYNKFIYDRKRQDQQTNLTYDDFLGFAAIKACHYCGESVYWAVNGLSRNGARYNLDRKDNSRGYLKDNVVVCCWRCNETKSDRFTYEQFLEIGNVIRSFNS